MPYATLVVTTGGPGELILDTDDDSLYVQDGISPRGHRIQSVNKAISAPTTGGTVVMNAAETLRILTPAGTLATLTVTLPSSPANDQISGVSTTQIITALTVNAPGGATVAAPPTTLPLGGSFNMIYNESNTTWYPCP